MSSSVLEDFRNTDGIPDCKGEESGSIWSAFLTFELVALIPQPRARRASRAPLGKSHSVDDSVLSSTQSLAAASFGRPSSMLARVSSSASVEITTTNALAASSNNMANTAAITQKMKASSLSSAAGTGKSDFHNNTISSKIGGAVAPRRVLGDLSNTNKVCPRLACFEIRLTSAPFCFAGRSSTTGVAKMGLLRMARRRCEFARQRQPMSIPSLSLPSRLPWCPIRQSRQLLILVPPLLPPDIQSFPRSRLIPPFMLSSKFPEGSGDRAPIRRILIQHLYPEHHVLGQAIGKVTLHRASKARISMTERFLIPSSRVIPFLTAKDSVSTSMAKLTMSSENTASRMKSWTMSPKVTPVIRRTRLSS